jgi:quercetin dioxygenase-like cupin family protein
MSYYIDYRAHTGSRLDKPHKATLFESERIMVGLNCLEPGQTQPLHDHADADKFYFVVEGSGRFAVGGEMREAGPGTLVACPAGVPHGVENAGSVRLTFLTGIAPWHR